MSKPNGVVTWKAFALFVVIGGAVLAGCWGYAMSANASAQTNAVGIAVANAQAEGVREDIREIRAEQQRQSKKLDDILERLSR